MGTIGILADEGKPERDVRRMLADLLDDLHSGEDEDGTRTLTGTHPGVGTVEFRVETVPLSPDGSVMLATYARRILHANDWDRLIYVTDLPLTAWNRPVVSQRATHNDATLISLPALGAIGVRRRLREELTGLIEDGHARRGIPGRPGRDPAGDDAATLDSRILDHRGRSWQLLTGMVRCNEPGQLLRVLSSSLAAIAATGGFGIFYGSIWNMAEVLSLPRLLMISLVAVLGFAGWLIAHNRLWHRSGTQETRWRERIDNLATIGTIGITTLIIYSLALMVMLISAVTVIPPDYLESELGREIDPFTYVSIAWLSASLGTMAGALGSNFDRDVEIRSATYNLREYQRRMQAGHYLDD